MSKATQPRAQRRSGLIRAMRWGLLPLALNALGLSLASEGEAQPCTVRTFLTTGCRDHYVGALDGSIAYVDFAAPWFASRRSLELPLSVAEAISERAGPLPPSDLLIWPHPSPPDLSDITSRTSWMAILRVGSVASPEQPGELPHLDWNSTFGFGTIAEIGVKLDLIAKIVDLVLSPSAGKQSWDVINVVVNSWDLLPFLELSGQSTFGLDDQLRPFMSNVTIRLNTEILGGRIKSATELDPETLQVLREHLKVTLGLGRSTSLSGETIFEQGLGLTSQIFEITSEVGNSIKLTGQAIFTPTSQEFRIGATICDLAFTSSSLITATGQIQQSFGVNLRFGGPSATTEPTPCR